MIYRLILTTLLIIGTGILISVIPYDFKVYFRKNWDSYRVVVGLKLLRGRLGLCWGPHEFTWQNGDGNSTSEVLEAMMKSLERINEMRQGLRERHDLFIILSKVIKKSRLKELKWHTELGFADPALTAVSVGVLWAVKGWFCSGLRAEMGAVSPGKIKPGIVVWGVHPSFNRVGLRIDVKCRLSGRLSGLMVPLFKFLMRYVNQGLKKLGYMVARVN